MATKLPLTRKLYCGIVKTADKFVPKQLRPLWEHEAGPQTIFFWAPAFKWGLVIASLGDLRRDPKTISIPQTVALTATGLIWSRYSMVITPKNYSLFAVNVFVATTSLYQLSRALMYGEPRKSD